MSNNNKTDLTTVVYQQLKKEIITGKRMPGSIFNEKEFAEQMGISRTPVREAVLKLSGEGLFIVMPRRGTMVSHISMNNIIQLYEVRKIIEPQIALIASKKADKNLLEEWIIFFESQKKAPYNINEDFKLPGDKSLGVYPDPDAIFHIFIAESTGNDFLIRQVNELMTLTQRIRCISNKVKEDRYIKSINEHINIAKAIISDDGSSERAVLTHLENSEKGYLHINSTDYSNIISL